jgi:hypothetical protein
VRWTTDAAEGHAASQIIYRNPFLQLAEALGSLHALYMRELGPEEAAQNARVAEVLGAICGLVHDCENLRTLVDELGRIDPSAYQAFQRTLEKFPTS